MVKDRRVVLRAVTEWRPNTCICTSIPIYMAADQEELLLREITPFETADKVVGDGKVHSTTTKDAPVLPQRLPADRMAEPSAVAYPLLLEIGHCLHAHVFAIVKNMTAPVLSFGFIEGRALFIAGKAAETDARSVFLIEAQNLAHGLTPRRR